MISLVSALLSWLKYVLIDNIQNLKIISDKIEVNILNMSISSMCMTNIKSGVWKKILPGAGQLPIVTAVTLKTEKILHFM